MTLELQNERLEALELKIMDLENTVQELNDVILRQYRDIDRMQGQLQHLTQRIDNTAPDSANPTAADELPPHY